MQQQARNFSVVIAENAGQPPYLIHDRDGAFLPLDQVLRPAGIKLIKTPPQSPMCNAVVSENSCTPNPSPTYLSKPKTHSVRPYLHNCVTLPSSSYVSQPGINETRGGPKLALWIDQKWHSS